MLVARRLSIGRRARTEKYEAVRNRVISPHRIYMETPPHQKPEESYSTVKGLQGLGWVCRRLVHEKPPHLGLSALEYCTCRAQGSISRQVLMRATWGDALCHIVQHA